MKFMNKIMPSCKEVSELTSLSMDESLSWRKRFGKYLHLKMCEFCRRNEAQLKMMRTMASKKGKENLDQNKLSDDAVKRISESLKHNDTN